MEIARRDVRYNTDYRICRLPLSKPQPNEIIEAS
jgi:hypothetical protein